MHKVGCKLWPALTFVLVGAMPSRALAEVMDKEPSVGRLWVTAAVGAAIALGLAAFRRWLPLVTLPIAAAVIWTGLLELHDPDIGAAIVAEAGSSYLVHAYGSFALLALAHVGPLGVWAAQRFRRADRA